MRHLLTKPIITFLIVIFILSIAFPVAAQSGWGPSNHGAHAGNVTYVVKPGDRLASIARQFCTTWQEIHYLNYYTIGPNPNDIYPGMVLIVPNRCGGGGGGCYDKGPLPHASGYVYGNRYHVLGGDTWYSIGHRFGVPYQHLQRANGSYRLLAGTTIVIPCLNAPMPPHPEPWPPTPTPIPPIYPTPTPTVQPVNPPYVWIISPLANAILPTTFTVNGGALNLVQHSLLIKVVDQQGNVLAQQDVSVQQANGIEINSSNQVCISIPNQEAMCAESTSQLSASVQNTNQDSGYWSAQFTVNAAPGTAGRIEAIAPGTNAKAIVSPVFFGQNGSGSVDYLPGQCQIMIAAGAPAYDQPDGTPVGQFVSAGTLESQRREQVNGTDWYKVQVQVNSQPRDLWVSAVDLTGIGSGCY